MPRKKNRIDIKDLEVNLTLERGRMNVIQVKKEKKKKKPEKDILAPV